MTKLDKVKQLFLSGDKLGALRIVAGFPRLGIHRETITKAWSAHQHHQFYRDIGQDPEALVKAGFDAIQERYSL